MIKFIQWRKQERRPAVREKFLAVLSQIVEELNVTRKFDEINYEQISSKYQDRLKENVPISDSMVDTVNKTVQFVIGRKLRSVYQDRNPSMFAIPLSEFYYMDNEEIHASSDKKPLSLDWQGWLFRGAEILQKFQERALEPGSDVPTDLDGIFRRWTAGHRGSYGLHIVKRGIRDPFVVVDDAKHARMLLNSIQKVDHSKIVHLHKEKRIVKLQDIFTENEMKKVSAS